VMSKGAVAALAVGGNIHLCVLCVVLSMYHIFVSRCFDCLDRNWYVFFVCLFVCFLGCLKNQRCAYGCVIICVCSYCCALGSQEASAGKPRHKEKERERERERDRERERERERERRKKNIRNVTIKT